MGLQRHLQIFSRQFYTQILWFAIKIPRHYQILILRSQEYNDLSLIHIYKIQSGAIDRQEKFLSNLKERSFSSAVV